MSAVFIVFYFVCSLVDIGADVIEVVGFNEGLLLYVSLFSMLSKLYKFCVTLVYGYSI
jgi:hypothetical protein